MSPGSGASPIYAPILGINSDNLNMSGPNLNSIDPLNTTLREFKFKPDISNSQSTNRDHKLTGAYSCASHTCLDSSAGAYSCSQILDQKVDG